MAVDPISLEVFKNMLISVAEEMGVAPLCTSYSPNIKERRAGKEILDVEAGDILSIRAPGGEGWGTPDEGE